MAGGQQLTYFVPVIRIDRQTALDLLCGAGDVDGGRHQILCAVPDQQYLDTMVLIPFHAAEVGPIGLSVHLSMTIGIHRAALLGDDGVPQPPAHRAWRPRLPGLHNHIGQAADEKLEILGRLHHAVRRDVIRALDEHRSAVRMRGGQDQLARIEIRQAIPDPLAHLLDESAPERREVAGNEQSLVDHLRAAAALQSQRHGRHR